MSVTSIASPTNYYEISLVRLRESFRKICEWDLHLQLPANTAAYTYMGSFTTPPCTESVEWLIFRDPVRASREQLNAFAARLKPNNRPVQSLNGRLIESGTVTLIPK